MTTPRKWGGPQCRSVSALVTLGNSGVVFRRQDGTPGPGELTALELERFIAPMGVTEGEVGFSTALYWCRPESLPGVPALTTFSGGPMSLNYRRRTPSHVSWRRPVANPKSSPKPTQILYLGRVVEPLRDSPANAGVKGPRRDGSRPSTHENHSDLGRSNSPPRHAESATAEMSASQTLVLRFTSSMFGLAHGPRASTFFGKVAIFGGGPNEPKTRFAADPGGGQSIAICGDAEKERPENVQANAEGALRGCG